MRRLIITVSIIKLFCNICLAQTTITEYETEDFDLIGTVSDKPVFRYIYSSDDKGGELLEGFYQWGLYYLEFVNNQYYFKLYKDKAFKFGRAYFVSDSLEIYWDYNEPTLLKVKFQGRTYDIHHKKNVNQKPSFCKLNKRSIVYSVYQGSNCLNVIELNNDVFNTILPLNGKNPFTLGNYLYFDFYHIDKNKVTPCPSDLYRVKIGDWNNPELLVEFISDSWLPLNDSIVLMTLPIKGKGKQVLYNINNKTYIKTEKTSTKLINYEGKEYLLATDKDNEGNKKYILKSLPEIPAKGYVKDNQREILPRVLHVNLPNHQKQFPNTFITDELLYEASEKELNKFAKEELRRLRNVFYARRGYKFKSNDLKEFFSQFEWYNQLLESNKYFEITNEDVVITEKDKARAELIREIENKK